MFKIFCGSGLLAAIFRNLSRPGGRSYGLVLALLASFPGHADDVAAGAVITVKSGRIRISKT